ncbi:sensor histidine kinase [Lentzea guizhouensis]|uniref:sensor histidine kinase n=1 Tax=Lentzea guizhouensis TaxID=1586287 RepID=UPI00300228AB
MRFRITVVATGMALLCLLAFTGLAPSLIGLIQITAVDQELRAEAPRVLDVSGEPVDGKPRPELTAQDIRALKAGEPVLRHEGASAYRWRGQVVFLADGTPRLEVYGDKLLGYENANVLGTRWLLLAAALVAGFVGIATWLSVRSSLLPVERMRVAAGALPHGQRLPVPPARDELQALAEALNALLTRRDEASDRLRRFTGDAAHELRSPVASVRAQAEVAVAHPDPDFSIEVLESVVEESIRLSRLVDSLLILARADTAAPSRAEAVDLVLEAEAAIGRLGTELLVRLNAPPSACLVSATRSEVELVLDNLLRNAGRYAYSTVTVALVPVGRDVRLIVDDDGHGIPAEHRAKVFDRFYRVEEDRGRASGGFGLGLALVAHLVQRRGGSGGGVTCRWRAF